jgi:hypothetical protein
MDPNECLAEIRRLTHSYHDHGFADGVRMIELVSALDEWLTNGGFKPTEWEN